MFNNKIQTFVFLDLETTGLPQYEYNRTKIIELCMVAVEAKHLELGVFPRAHNKLSLCFNPDKFISIEASRITGLDNELLEDKSKFTAATVQMIQQFLKSNPSPICLVAHNGNRFDFPILRAEIFNANSTLDDEILCLDSLNAFQNLEQLNNSIIISHTPTLKKQEVPFEFNDDYDELLCQIADDLEESLKENEKKLTPAEIQTINETTPEKNLITKASTSKSKSNRNLFNNSRISYKLSDIYKRLTCKTPVLEHQAEGDVVMMLTCCAVFGEKFVQYACNNSKKFSDIPRMQPGRSLGR